MPIRDSVSPERRLAAAICAGLVVVALTGCAPTRSVAAYCSSVQQHKDRYLSSMQDATKRSALIGLLESASAIGDLQTMWSDLAKVAPSDVQTDTETVRDAWTKVQDDASDKKVLAALTTAVAAAPAMSRVNTWIASHCGASLAPDGTGVVASASAVASPTPSDSLTGEPIALAASGPDSAAEGDLGPNGMIQGARNSGDTGVDISTAAVAGGTVEQAQASVSVDWNVLNDSRWAVGAQQDGSGNDFVVAAMHHQAAEGLQPERWTTTLQSLDAGSSSPGQQLTFTGCRTVECQLTSVTLFGHVALLAYTPGSDSSSFTTTSDHLAAIDTDTGSVLWDRKGVDVDATTRSAVVVERSDPDYDGNTSVFALDPETGATTWTFRDAKGQHSTGFVAALGDRYAIVTSPFTAPDSYGGVDAIDVVDLQDGALVATRYGSAKGVSAANDPTTQRIVLAGVGADASHFRDDQTGFEVLSAAGASVLTVGPEQWAELDSPRVLGALDGRVWIDGQNGVDVIASDTGKQDPASPQLTGSGSGSSPLYPDRTIGHLTIVSGTESYGGSAVVITPDGYPGVDAVNGISAAR